MEINKIIGIAEHPSCPGERLPRFATFVTTARHLDKHGYVRFRNWRFFGEDGLAGEEVSVWVTAPHLRRPLHEVGYARKGAEGIPTPWLGPHLTGEAILVRGAVVYCTAKDRLIT